MMCCNQMGDKGHINLTLQALKNLVHQAYTEGQSNGAKSKYAITFTQSNVKQELDKLNIEVL